MSNAFDDATQLSERSNEPHGKQGYTMPKLPERLGIEHHESTDVDGTVLGTHGTTAPVTTNAPTVTPTAAPTITVTPGTAAPTERMTSWQATTERQPAASEQVRRQPTTGTMPDTLNTGMMPAAGADIVCCSKTIRVPARPSWREAWPIPSTCRSSVSSSRRICYRPTWSA